MKPLIVALDVETDKEAFSLVKQTSAYCDVYKVGPTLVMRYGPQIFKKIHALRRKIFLDMKYHDIPNTMMRCVREAGLHKIFSTTVHATAGLAAMSTVAAVPKRPKIWGVTVLTSMTEPDLQGIGVLRGPLQQVIGLAGLAKEAQIDGVVASVEETTELRRALGPEFTIVTPGIRMPSDEPGDQKRVATPAAARQAGSTFIVVGRPIIEAQDPKLAAKNILGDWNQGSIS